MNQLLVWAPVPFRRLPFPLQLGRSVLWDLTCLIRFLSVALLLLIWLLILLPLSARVLSLLALPVGYFLSA